MKNASNSAPSRRLKFCRDNRGSAMPMFAFGLLVVFGAGALGVDFARAVSMRNFLSNAADAAALAAVSRLPDAAAARAAAIEYVGKNVPPSEYGTIVDDNDVEIGTWDSVKHTFIPAADPNSGGTAVRVTAHVSEARGNRLTMYFGAVLGRDNQDISASAVAGRGGPPCVMVLDPSSSQSMFVSSSKLKAVACGLQINSKATGALNVDGSSTVDATGICVGGTSTLKGGDVSPTPNDYCLGKADPLAGLAAPAVGSCDHNNAKFMNTSQTLLPGVYCGGLSISNGSDITLSDGIYVIKDGAFLVNNSKVSGTDITIFLTGSTGVLNIKGDSELDLTAPTAGNFKGILFYQDRNYSGFHSWGGRAATNLKGVIYLPKGTIWSKNDNVITPEDSCTVIIVKILGFYAGSGATIDLSSKDCRSGLAEPYARGIVLLE